MAKIDTLKFEIDGETYTSNVNVGKDGMFKTSIHWKVMKAINLPPSACDPKSSKDKLVTPIIRAYNDYLESKREFSLFIAIEYKASKAFAYKANGHALYRLTDHRYYVSGFEKVVNKLHFGYRVYCKEVNSVGSEVWHEVEKIKEGCDNKFSKTIVGDHYLGSVTYSVDGKLIPYSVQALETLDKAKEGIRSISEILFNFVDQEPEMISNQLNKGNLLGPISN